MVAITTKFRDRDINEGMAAGFTAYLEKLNEEQLLNQIDKLINKGKQ
ncbi:MAG: response regulator [Bdellovibrionales bacterium]|nr:response regulator [Bdellovibrionales bacterium]